jgi:hypothetical protein
MILAYTYVRGKRLTLAFNDGHMPRTGEFITLGSVYKIVRVTHRFHSQKNVPNALENQEYFSDVPALDIELEKE